MNISRVATAIGAALLIVATAGLPGSNHGRAEAISFWGEENAPTPQAVPEAESAAPEEPPKDKTQVPIVTSLPDFATIADRVGPAVVNISTTSQPEAQPQQQNPFERGNPGNPNNPN